VTNKGKTKYVSFYLLLANSMTAFNNQQYRRFPSIFRVEYEVGNWPLTGSIGIRKSGSYHRIRPSLDGVDSSSDKTPITTIPTVGVYSSSDKKTIATFPAFQDDLLSASPLEIRPQIRVNVVELIYD